MQVNVAVSPGRDIYDSLEPRVNPILTGILMVDLDSTLGSVWEEYRAILNANDPLVGNPGGLAITRESLPPYLLQHAAVVRDDGQLEWSRPWVHIKLSELASLYPSPVVFHESTDALVFVESPQTGQGFDLGWATLLDILQHATHFMGHAVTWYGGFEIVRKIIPGFHRRSFLKKRGDDDQTEALKRIEEGIRVLREVAPRWEQRGGQPYNIKEVLQDPQLRDEDKARMLGLRDAKEVPVVAAVLTPNETLMRTISAMPDLKDSAMMMGRSWYINAILRPVTFPCACKYEECTTRGSLHYTANGLKIGLDRMSDHFTFPPEVVPEVISAGQDFVLREQSIQKSMEE